LQSPSIIGSKSHQSIIKRSDINYRPKEHVNMKLKLEMSDSLLSRSVLTRSRQDYQVSIEAPNFNSRKISASIVIDGTIDDVWTILTDYNNLATHVPNLVKSYLVPGPPNTIRLFQEGAQRIIGFDFRASVTIDMTEEPVDSNRALRERQLSFKLADSFMFSSFDGSWNLRYHSRIPRTDPITQEVSYQYKTLLTYSVFVRPKGPVPVIALEWRIKEDIPTNLEGMKSASEQVAASRRNMNSNNNGRALKTTTRVWGTEETLGLYMVKGRRG